MHIGIIGAGFTGLATAYYLVKAGHQVEVFERESSPGGLAIGFKDSAWDWPLEAHYHHLFTSDKAIHRLAQEVQHPLVFTQPITATYYSHQIYRLDSPTSLLKFSPLPLADRLRTAFGLVFLRFNPFWQPFEYFTAQKYITSVMGSKSWRVLWEPLFAGKFGQRTPDISAAWFWARIYKRSPSLGYPQGGFQSLANSIAQAAAARGARFSYQSSVGKISPSPNGQIQIHLSNSRSVKFDRVVCTLPTPLFSQISNLSYSHLDGLGAVNLVLALKRDFLPPQIYWLNVNDRSLPFLAVVEHTHFQKPSHYAGDHLVYVGNYLPSDHRFFHLSALELVREFTPHLKRINSKFSPNWIRKSWLFKAPFAQPIITPHYSRFLPPLTTPIPHLYLANIQQVYPWDRGTNYAVELGLRASHLCTS